MTALIGRERELGVIDDFVDRAPERGGALLVRGEAGIGKSVLLAAAKRRAQERGMLVLTTSGVQSEARLPFAGLHQLLRPILETADELPGPQRAALLAAFGMAEAAAPELFLIALATLNVLAEAAIASPVLLLADDVQWLDQPTVEVLGFLARRLDAEPVVLVFALREGFDSPLGEVDLPELGLGGLDREAAGALLDVHAPTVASAVRERLLDEAMGNPLALVELPNALGPQRLQGGILPTWLPLSTRLERAFAARMSDLPAVTRSLLIVAAVDDGGILAEVLGAGGIMLGTASTFAFLEPAIAARLVEVDDPALRFRHPLIRSAVYQSASASQGRAAHAALAQILANQPDRRAWHRAASIVGPSEEVAAELEAAARRAQQRGGIAVAVAALERAATLTEDPGRNAGRLLRAAELAVELGARDLVGRLVRQTEGLPLSPEDVGLMTWIRETFAPGRPGDPATVRSLVGAAERAREAGDNNLALKLLWAAASSGFWADRGEEMRDHILAAAERVAVDEDDPRLLSIFAYAAPIQRGAVVVERASRWVPSGGEPEAMDLLGSATATVGAHDLSIGFFASTVDSLRKQGRLLRLAQVLVVKAWAEIHLGRWNIATSDAEEAGRLAYETAQPIWGAAARVAQSILAGLRGEKDTAEVLAAEAEGVGITLGASAVLAIVQLARGLTALGDGYHREAYDQLRRMFDRADPAHHHMESCWAVGNLAEAGAYGGRRDEARALVEELEPLAKQTPSPWFHVAMRHARALLADDADAEALFQQGLQADLTRWPFDRARLQLAYGTWLRRQRRVTDARAPLRAARDAFDALAAISWGKRARQELRASGETSHGRVPQVWERLTPQELQICQMAAEGLSNREIGERLYLSPRTISTHLYHVFPKLGITSRAELNARLLAGGSRLRQPTYAGRLGDERLT